MQPIGYRNKQHKVIHFDWLKPCSDNIQLDISGSTPAESPATADTSPQPIPPVPGIGESLELFEDDGCKQSELARPTPSTSSAH